MIPNEDKRASRLSKSNLKQYQQHLAETYPICQVCHEKPTQDLHHLFFGCYGADKDDTSLIAVCRDCHEWLHKNKHEGQEKFKWLAKDNWEGYNENS